MAEDKKSSDWASYNSNSEGARPRLLETLEKYAQTPGYAADLGCGGGRDTRELLKRGWSVDAIDSDLSSLEILQQKTENSDALKIVPSSFEMLKLEPNTYDLINASNSLPFCNPQSFATFWKTIVEALKPGGLVSCEFFGRNDDWAKLPRPAKTMTFLSLNEVQALVKDLKIEVLKEEELERATFEGSMKHWHLITCIARKK